MKGLLLLPFLIILLGTFSCSDNKNDVQSRTVFRYNELGGITSLDPAAARTLENIWAVNQLFNGLVQMNDSLHVVPCIAHSWEISENLKTYTFHLRNDVFFHDNKVFPKRKGRKVVAQDFAYSFNRLLNPSISSALSLLENIDNQKNNAFDAQNDSTFVIHLKKPFTPFLSILTMKYFSVVPQEGIIHYGVDFARNPIGTGPFVFKIWKEGSKMVLLKNDNYFEYEGKNRLPYIDAVSISFVKDKEAAFMSFMGGSLDMISGVDAINMNKIFTTDGRVNETYRNEFILQKAPSLKTDYLGFLIDVQLAVVKKSPTKIKALRQAINYGFDKKKMVKYLRKNVGFAATGGIVPVGLPSYDESKVIGYDYNPQKARELLVEAGFPQGNGLPEIPLSTTEQYLELAEFIQSQLRELGITIKIEVQPASSLSEAISHNKIIFFRKSWVADYPDEENFLSIFYSKNASPKGFNYTHFSDPNYDRLYEKALVEKSDSLRYEYYREMDRLMLQESPIVPLYYDEVLRLVQNNVAGLKANAMNILSLKNVKKI